MVGPSTTPQLPGYRDLAPLGRGGYSEVYRAYQDQFDRWVAVKVLTFALTDDRSQRRFLRECRVAGRLSAHPNIVTVYDAGLSPDGRPYISMELFDHGSIADRLRRGGPFDLADVLRIAVGLAGALETAHRAGVVHRDVKPANVLMAAYGQPALTDFGLSILAERQEVSIGVDALTPYHAPPEVLERTAVTATSDVYSLASTTYAMLAGRAPHQRDDQDSMASLLLRILQVDVPPVGRADVPHSLDTTLRRALARDAHARTRTALDFAHGVQQVQAEMGFDVTQPIVMDAPKGGDAVPPPPGLDPSPTAITQPDPPSPGAPREPTVPFGTGVPGDATIDRPTFAARFADPGPAGGPPDPGAPAGGGPAPDGHGAPAWDPNGHAAGPGAPDHAGGPPPWNPSARPGAEPPAADQPGGAPPWNPGAYPGGTAPDPGTAAPAWEPSAHPTGPPPADRAGGAPSWGPDGHAGAEPAGPDHGGNAPPWDPDARYPASAPPSWDQGAGPPAPDHASGAPAWHTDPYPGSGPSPPDQAGTAPPWHPNGHPDAATPPWDPNANPTGSPAPDQAGTAPPWHPNGRPDAATPPWDPNANPTRSPAPDQAGTAPPWDRTANPGTGPAPPHHAASVAPSWPPGAAPAGGRAYGDDASPGYPDTSGPEPHPPAPPGMAGAPGGPGDPAPGSASVFAPPSPGGPGPGAPGQGPGPGPGGAAWPDAVDGEQTVHRSVLRQMPKPEPEPERTSRKGLFVAGGALLVLGLGVGGAFMVTGGGDEDDPPPSTTTTTVELEIPTGLTAAESPAGVQLTWQGEPDGAYYALILSETEPPRFLPASGPSLLITSGGLQPDVGYCFSVASLDTLDQADAEQTARAFSTPACIRGASEDTVITE